LQRNKFIPLFSRSDKFNAANYPFKSCTSLSLCLPLFMTHRHLKSCRWVQTKESFLTFMMPPEWSSLTSSSFKVNQKRWKNCNKNSGEFFVWSQRSKLDCSKILRVSTRILWYFPLHYCRKMWVHLVEILFVFPPLLVLT